MKIRKKKIPPFPSSIGVITSESGAVFSDIMCCLHIVAFLSNVISSDCYKWVFKIHKLPSGCHFGVYNVKPKPDELFPIGDSEVLCSTEEEYQFKDGDIIEMILDFGLKTVCFLACNSYSDKKSVIKMHWFSCLHADDGYVGGIKFTKSAKGLYEEGKIELIQSEYINTETYLYNCEYPTPLQYPSIKFD